MSCILHSIVWSALAYLSSNLTHANLIKLYPTHKYTRDRNESTIMILWDATVLVGFCANALKDACQRTGSTTEA